MAALASLTEDTIRSRVNLKHDNLEDVKSLSLPGTYHEKVAELGTSLRKFTRLKHLDLSRNALTSLAGLEHLNLLETLNLYYNSISSLDELRCLRHNSQLTEIDLRLNPVARDEPDYRLFLIHLLPNLQKLDDRGVRDRERQAALVHFTSGQAAEFSSQVPVPTPQEKPSHPRAEYVRSVNKRVTALDDDDVEVLDLIARTGGDLSKPRQITGSAARCDDMQEYSLDVLKGLPDSALETRIFPTEHSQKLVKPQTVRSDPSPPPDPNSLASRYPNIPLVPVTRSRSPSTSPRSTQSNGLQQYIDPNLKYTDEAEAYTKFKGQGFFTPHPGYVESDGCAPPAPLHSLPHPGGPPSPKPLAQVEERRTDRAEVYTTKQQPFPVQKLDFDSTCHQAPPPQQAPPPGSVSFPDNATPPHRQFLIRLMDLVDKYWNGSRSLHKNHKFKSLAVELLYSLESSQTQRGTLTASDQLRLEDRVTSLTEENRALREREASYKQITTTSSLNETELKASLKQAYDDVEALRSHLQKYVNENKRLQKRLKDLELSGGVSTNGGMSTNGATSANASTVNQSQLNQLERENNELRQETERLKIRVKQLSQMQEVATMLQESHKSLVQTNDHLLREIEENRVRHKDEVRQLHWSYDQLKRTMNSINTSAVMSGTVIE